MSTFSISKKPSTSGMWLTKENMSHTYSALHHSEIIDVFISREGEFNREIITKLHEKNKRSTSFENECAVGSTFMHFLDSYYSWNILRKEIKR